MSTATPSTNNNRQRSAQKLHLQPLKRTVFRPEIGSYVRVADADRISAMLDAQGRTDGLPMMPEMLKFCGQQMRVLRWANSVCIFGEKIRFQKLQNCVVLEMPRCCGSGHGGCQMGCAFFWRTEWLEPSDPPPTDTPLDPNESTPSPQLVTLLKSAAKNDQLFQCQATQLGSIAKDPGNLKSRLSDEYNLNRMRVSQFASDVCSTLLAKASRTQAGLAGPCDKRTPADDLNLQVGDRVRVKSKQAILQTLNADGKNRGLWFDTAMLKYCGQSMQVTRRVEQFINESTGKMIRPSVPSIVLDEEHCSGRGRHYCSRLLHFFWREIWLEREAA